MEDNNYLLLKQEFRSYKETTDKQIEELKKQIEDHEKRIQLMEKSKEKTDYQYEQIIQTLNKLNEKTIPDLTMQIEELRNKPIKRYETIIGSILGAIFGAVGGSIASFFLKGNS